MKRKLDEIDGNSASIDLNLKDSITSANSDRKKSSKMEMEIDSAVHDNCDNIPETDSAENDAFVNKLLASKGHKFFKLLCSRPKEFCKLILDTEQSTNVACLKDTYHKAYNKCILDRDNHTKLCHKLQNLDSLVLCDGEFYKTMLKYGMKACANGSNGYFLISVLNAVYSVYIGSIVNPILGIQMILSHSKAEDIFLESITQPKFPKNELIKENYTDIKCELLRLWSTLVQSFVRISKQSGTETDKKILEDSLPYLMQMYGATLSPSDTVVFQLLELYCSKKLKIGGHEAMPAWGFKCFEDQTEAETMKANPLHAHSIRANKVLSSIQESKAFLTAMKFHRRTESTDFYDIRFLLPLLCHALDERNVCDGVKVVSNGWIYFIIRGLSLEDDDLRGSAFLAFQRLIFNFQQAKGYRLQDIKIWLHFLNGIKKGVEQLGTCKVSNLLSTWMIATWEVLKQPSHLMYKRITNFLLVKPVLELTILPDFIALFNASDGNRESRDWILNVLLEGLKTAEDWKIIQKLPTIKFLCCSFPLESIFFQRRILNILNEGASIPEVALDMIDKHSLLLWIANLPINGKMYRREVMDVFQNLWKSFSSDPTNFTDFRLKLFKFVTKKHGWEQLLTENV